MNASAGKLHASADSATGRNGDGLPVPVDGDLGGDVPEREVGPHPLAQHPLAQQPQMQQQPVRQLDRVLADAIGDANGRHGGGGEGVKGLPPEAMYLIGRTQEEARTADLLAHRLDADQRERERLLRRNDRADEERRAADEERRVLQLKLSASIEDAYQRRILELDQQIAGERERREAFEREFAEYKRKTEEGEERILRHITATAKRTVEDTTRAVKDAVAALQNENAALRDALEVAKGNQSCVVCWENTRSVLFRPCNHACVCVDCVDLLRECPLCKGAVEAKERVYIF